MGEKCVFVRVGKAFLCTKKGYYIPLIIGRRCREVGENAPNIELYRDGSQLPSHLTPASNLEL